MRASAFYGKLCLLVAAGALSLPTTVNAAVKLNVKPLHGQEVARDLSPPLSELAAARKPAASPTTAGADVILDIRPERDGPLGAQPGSGVDGAAQTSLVSAIQDPGPPLPNFEGLSNQDNFNIFGGRVNPPDPVGAVGPHHYVEMINLVFGVYDKQGNLLLGPVDTGTLWSGFPIDDCTDPSGDPIVLYDRVADRWLLTQFTTRGLSSTTAPFYNCVAISATGDPTGAYYRYAFTSGVNFPDYPKYGVYNDTYVVTTREFGPFGEYGIGIYALERRRMLQGLPARSVAFFLDGNNPNILPLVGDGLLPAYHDGKTKPTNKPIPIVGTQDDGAGYGATFDAINIFDLNVRWRDTSVTASLVARDPLPVASFDSIFPCAPTSRDCLPQPGIVNPSQYLDILSYRQRPTWRLAYRNFGTHESLVTAQSVEAAPGVAGMRWYEIRRVGNNYSLYQQGTFAPGDGVHRWMGSVSMDKQGNIGLGYSVVNGVDVYPGIRYTGRLAGDPLGLMTLGEGTIINGSGVQTTTNSRWGDYTSLNPDPLDDCTLWYVNQYYTAAGQASSSAGWQTRIGGFRIPGCS